MTDLRCELTIRITPDGDEWVACVADPNEAGSGSRCRESTPARAVRALLGFSRLFGDARIPVATAALLRAAGPDVAVACYVALWEAQLAEGRIPAGQRLTAAMLSRAQEMEALEEMFDPAVQRLLNLVTEPLRNRLAALDARLADATAHARALVRVVSGEALRAALGEEKRSDDI